jgi:DNA-binding NarL/FixJ family response regulator
MQQSLHSRGSVVLVIDALELRRAGVESLLKPWAQANGASLVASAPRATPAELGGQSFKLIVLVIGALGVDDPEPQRWINSWHACQADTPLVLVSDRDEPDQVVAAFKAGVRGFIPTSIAPSVAVQALSLIMCGGTFFPVSTLMLSIHVTRSERSEPRDDHPNGQEEHARNQSPYFRAVVPVQAGRLTMRQKEVLNFLQLGDSNKSIARSLKMRESTVKVHVRQIMRKLGASNRTQAALSAARLGSHDGPASGQSVESAVIGAGCHDKPSSGDKTGAVRRVEEVLLSQQTSRGTSILHVRAQQRRSSLA